MFGWQSPHRQRICAACAICALGLLLAYITTGRYVGLEWAAAALSAAAAFTAAADMVQFWRGRRRGKGSE
jgi:cytochrome c peroxidase